MGIYTMSQGITRNHMQPSHLPEETPPDPKKWLEFLGGKNPPDLCDWPRHLLSSFGLRPLHDEPNHGVHLTVQMLYMPSFHPECCVTVSEEENPTRVSLVTHSTNLWSW